MAIAHEPPTYTFNVATTEAMKALTDAIKTKLILESGPILDAIARDMAEKLWRGFSQDQSIETDRLTIVVQLDSKRFQYGE